MADAGVFDVDQHFIRAGFCNWIEMSDSVESGVETSLTWYLLIFDWSSCLLNDHCPLLIWDFLRHDGFLSVLLVCFGLINISIYQVS